MSKLSDIKRKLFTVSQLSITPPRAAANRHGITLVAIVLNEAEYIGEWLSYHATAGVDRFIIYDNGSTDNTRSVIVDTLPAETVTIIPWCQTLRDRHRGTTLHNQILAYAHAVSNFGTTCRWMTFIDIDEFIIPKAPSISDALMSLSDAKNISLPWHMFGNGGHKTRPEGGVLENYLMREKTPPEGGGKVRSFKYIVDPCHVTHLRVHSAEVDNEAASVNDAGQIMRHSQRFAGAFYTAKRLQLNHYYTRSEEEFLAKIHKGHIVNEQNKRYAAKIKKVANSIEADPVKDTTAFEYANKLGVIKGKLNNKAS